MNNQELLDLYGASIATLSPITKQVRRSNISDFFSFLETKKINPLTVTKEDLIQYAEYKQKTCKDFTIKKYLLYILYFYRLITEKSLFLVSELHRIEDFVLNTFTVETGEEGIVALRDSEVNQLMQATAGNPVLRFSTWCFLNMGFRLSELYRLNISDVDLVKEVITVRKSKGKKTRRIPLLKYQVKPIKEWLDYRKILLPLHSKEKAFIVLKSTEARASKQWYQYMYSELSDKLDFRIYPHRLRKTMASILFFKLNVPIDLIQFILGHSNIQTTMRYLKISEQMKIENYRQSMQSKKIIDFDPK